jgi:hypothetical protein
LSVLLRLLMVLALIFGAADVRADEPSQERVRTGRTELAGPAAGDAEPPAAEPVGQEVSAPADAPRLFGDQVRMPPVPAGFSTYDGGFVRFSYHPSTRERIEPLIAAADETRRELEVWLGQPVLSRVRVDIARTPREMKTFAPAGAPYPEYAAGVAYSDLGLVLLTLTPVSPNDQHDVVQTFRHELAHVALKDALSGRPVARWFNEGFAVLASGETSFERLSTLWTATVADRLLPLSEVERSFPSDAVTASVAYAQAVDVVRFLVRREERHRFRALIRELREGSTLDAAARAAYGVDLITLEREWREDVAKRYTFWPILMSGTGVWAAVVGLFLWGWKKRRARSRATLERWARDEAREDELRKMQESSRIHIVLARAPAPGTTMTPVPGTKPPEIEVPRVQHEGEWHTLH